MSSKLFKRLSAVLLVVAILLTPVTMATAQTGTSTTAEVSNFRWIIRPSFDHVRAFSEGLAVVNVGGFLYPDEDGEPIFGQWAVIDKEGNFVIDFSSDFVAIYPFSHGFATVTMRGDEDVALFAFINREGEFAFPDRFSSVLGTRVFDEGQIVVAQDEIWIIIDAEGNKVNSLVPDVISRFSEGRASLFRDDKVGVIDREGNEIVSPKYDGIGYFSDGMASVLLDGKWGFIDKTGAEVISPRFDAVQGFNYGVAGVMIDDMWGVIDRSGREVVPFIYDWIWEFCCGMARVELDEKVGIIDTEGNIIIPIIYDYVTCFFNGWATVVRDGRAGAIDIDGNIIVPLEFDNIGVFSEGVAAFLYDGRVGFMDENGDVVIPQIFDIAFPFIDGVAWVAVDGRWGPEWGLIALHDVAGMLVGSADWARAELASAINYDIMVDYLIENWTMPTTRLMVAEAIVRMLETFMPIEEIAEILDFDMTNTFADTQNRAVTFLKAAGISTGVDGVRFDPDGIVTRAQMVTMLGRMAENLFYFDVAAYPLGSEVFTDIPEWADIDVGWAVSTGITNGVGDGRFDSNGVLQNQHTGVFLYRMFRMMLEEYLR